MESRIKGRLLAIIVAGAMIASSSSVFAATTKPTPKKVVYTHKVVKFSPSPSPKWPPSGFSNPKGGEIFYKLPKAKELLSILSANLALSQQIARCTKVACGVVTLASSTGCTWWSVAAKVYGPLSPTDSSLAPYGDLTTTALGSKKKQIFTIALISAQPLKNNVNVGKLQINCHHDPVTTSPQKVPSNIYVIYTPTPAASPSEVAVTNTN